MPLSELFPHPDICSSSVAGNSTCPVAVPEHLGIVCTHKSCWFSLQVMSQIFSVLTMTCMLVWAPTPVSWIPVMASLRFPLPLPLFSSDLSSARHPTGLIPLNDSPAQYPFVTSHLIQSKSQTPIVAYKTSHDLAPDTISTSSLQLSPCSLRSSYTDFLATLNMWEMSPFKDPLCRTNRLCLEFSSFICLHANF